MCAVAGLFAIVLTCALIVSADPFGDVQPVAIVTNGDAFAGSTGIAKPAGAEAVVYFELISTDRETVDVEVIVDGQVKHVFHKLGPGGRAAGSFPAADFAGKTVKHCRWRPGLLGANGTGGGDASWNCPRDRTVKIVLKLNVS